MNDIWRVKTGYCPICNRDWRVRVFVCESSFSCPHCGHHLALHGVEVEKEKHDND